MELFLLTIAIGIIVHRLQKILVIAIPVTAFVTAFIWVSYESAYGARIEGRPVVFLPDSLFDVFNFAMVVLSPSVLVLLTLHFLKLWLKARADR